MNKNELVTFRSKTLSEQNWQEFLKYSELLFLLEPHNSLWIESCFYAGLMLEDWDKAISYGKKGIEHNDIYLNALDALSHAYGSKKDLENCRKYGSKALHYRHNQILNNVKLPKLPIVERKVGKKIISFSLYGGENPKYIEPAVLNTKLVSKIYPDWICRFYIDNSIPFRVIQRLAQNGAEIFLCDESLHHIPKTMWRFLALDDPNVSYVIFRDADSVISPRESEAVSEWLESGRYFHTIRDSGSHTELILAGLWGAVTGVLPNIRQMMNEYVKTNELDKRFSDQYFLRNYLWKYVHQSLYASNNIFDFLESYPIRGNVFVENSIGRSESSVIAKIENKNWGKLAKIKWSLQSRVDPLIKESFDDIKLLDKYKLICEYENLAENGLLELNLPRRYIMNMKYSKINVEVVSKE